MKCSGFSSHTHKISLDKVAPIKLFHIRKFGVVFPKRNLSFCSYLFGVFKEEYKISTVSAKLLPNLNHLVQEMEQLGTWNCLGN